VVAVKWGRVMHSVRTSLSGVRISLESLAQRIADSEAEVIFPSAQSQALCCQLSGAALICPPLSALLKEAVGSGSAA